MGDPAREPGAPVPDALGREELEHPHGEVVEHRAGEHEAGSALTRDTASGALEESDDDREAPSAEAREIFGIAFAAAEHFADMLADEGQLRGLVGPRELPRLWSRHLLNSAAVVPFLPRRGTVADVGSGAGFPGVVIALLRPDLEVTLIESMERRVEWLSDVVEELDLDNVEIRRSRAEDVQERFDAVTARAVANLSTLVRLTAALVRPGGALLALKGEKAVGEVEAAKYVIKKAKLEPAVIHEVMTSADEVTRVVEIRRRVRR